MTQHAALQGKKGLVVGIANADSIAFGCARAFRDAGADRVVPRSQLVEELHELIASLAMR